MMLRYLHEWGSPPVFYQRAGRWQSGLWALAALLMLAGLWGGLVMAPADYEQGEVYRIIYIHVPAAWIAMFAYVVMAVTGAIGLVWRLKVAEVLTSAGARVGASFTLVALATGAIWGQPTWGTWWVWDARLTSVLVLLFLYMGFIALENAIEDRRSAARACAILALVGVVNIPIIHFSVHWWNTLHQGPTVSRLSAPAIHASMLVPLLLMGLGSMLFYGGAVLSWGRALMLERERTSRWARDEVTG